MSLKCVIIDDEPLAVNVIKNYTEQIKDLVLVQTFNNAVDSLEYLQKEKIDLLFLDIDMPILDGYSFLESIDDKPMVVITTAHEEYALKGYELDVLDYMVKPIPFPRFLIAVNKAFVKKDSEKQKEDTVDDEKTFVFVKVDNKKIKKINFDDIIVVESKKDYIKIVTASGNYIVHQTLSGFTNKLPSSKFIRIHRSHTISLDKVSAIEGNRLEIEGKKYTIGRNYIEKTKKALFN